MTRELTLRVSDSANEVHGEVDALLQRPQKARWLLVLAHGAGAGMRHAFMESVAAELENLGVATLRYQFPYMQHRRGRPDTPAVLTAAIRSAIAAAVQEAPQLSLLAGGKSLGGRMTSHVFAEADAEAAESLKRVRGLVFFGFPLHPPGRPNAKPDTKRAKHLEQVMKPMLFLQGTRDTFAELSLLRPLCAKLAPRATLHIVDTADHSFHVLKSSGRTDADVIRELAQTVVSWADALA